MVYVTFTIPPTPCANCPNSLAEQIIHVSLYFGSRLMCLYSSILPMSVYSNKFANPISASLLHVSGLPFFCATTSIIFMRCSLLAALAALIFFNRPFDVVVFVDDFTASVYYAGGPVTLALEFNLIRSICNLGGAIPT